MTFRSLLERTVTIVPRVVTGTDGRGNDVVADGTHLEGVPATRDLDSATEDQDERDLERPVWLYFLPAQTDDGTTVTITGRDRLIDDGLTFEVLGDPEVIVRRRGGRVHHLEVRAYRVEG